MIKIFLTFLLLLPFISNSDEIVMECQFEESMVTSKAPGEKIKFKYNPKNSKVNLESFTFYSDGEYNDKFNNIGWHKNYETKVKFSEVFMGEQKQYFARFPIDYEFSFYGETDEYFFHKGEVILHTNMIDILLVFRNNSWSTKLGKYETKYPGDWENSGECKFIDFIN